MLQNFISTINLSENIKEDIPSLFYEITNSVNYGKEKCTDSYCQQPGSKDVIPVNQFYFPIYGGILPSCKHDYD